MGDDELSVQSHQNVREKLELELDRVMLVKMSDKLNTLPETRTINTNDKHTKINNYLKRLDDKKEQGKKLLEQGKELLSLVKKIFRG